MDQSATRSRATSNSNRSKNADCRIVEGNRRTHRPPASSRTSEQRPRRSARGDIQNAPGNTERRQDPAACRGFEAKLWQTADALRNNMDAAEYKHVVLGLIFLKYISDAFEAKHAELEADRAAGRRPRGPRRVPRREHLLGAEGGPLVAPEGQRAPAHDRHARRRRDDRHRARQPLAQGRAAQGLRPARPRQAAPRPAHQPRQRHRARQPRRPRQGHARPRLRVLPRPVRQRRGQEGRPVLHALPRRPDPRRDARAVQGPRLRPVLRLGRHVRQQREVHRGPPAAGSATSASTARSPTTPPGAWRR